MYIKGKHMKKWYASLHKLQSAMRLNLFKQIVEFMILVIKACMFHGVEMVTPSTLQVLRNKCHSLLQIWSNNMMTDNSLTISGTFPHLNSVWL